MMDDDPVVHVPAVAFYPIPFLDYPVEGIQVIQSEALAGLVPQRDAFPRVGVEGIYDGIREGEDLVVFDDPPHFAFEHLVVDGLEVMMDVEGEDVELPAISLAGIQHELLETLPGEVRALPLPAGGVVVDEAPFQQGG